MSYYAVANGFEIGIYRDWLSCKKNVINFPKSKYKKFSTEKEAEEFIKKYNDVPSSTEGFIKKYNDVPSSIDLPQDDNIYIFTDGSCSNNGKSNAMSGIGIYFGEDDLRNVSKKIEGKQTNNTSELSAIIEALKITEEETKNILICTDSEYCIKCVTYYGKKLKETEWKTSVPNIELIKELYVLSERSNIFFKHVKAHTYNDDFFSIGNKKANKLANVGRQVCSYDKIY